MNEREKIRSAIKEWQERENGEIKDRNVNFKLFEELDHIIDILGVRRSGKTYLMFMTIKKLEKEFGKDAIIYINFENKILTPASDRLLDEALLYFLERGYKKSFLFLDEIQNVKNWERWARTAYDSYKGKIKIIVSGSSSKIIRKDVASLLTGRHVSVKLFPLSFSEYIEFGNLQITKDDLLYSAKKQSIAKSMLDEYLRYGAFPEVCLEKNPQLKIELLRAYYDDILYRDVMEKHGIKEFAVMENFMKFLFYNISSYFSYKRGKEFLDSLGISTSTRTLLKYTSVLEEVFLFFFVPVFSGKARDHLRYPRKIYSIDAGLRNAVSPPSEDFGKIAENIVYLELRRNHLNEINYWKGRSEEVDFLVREGPKVRQIIQVCWDISSKKTEQREIRGLVSCAKELGLRKGLVITKDTEKEEKTDGVKISFIPLWKWLLSEKRGF